MHCEGFLIADARKTEPLAARGKPQGAKHKAGRSRGAPPELPVGTITRLRKPQQTARSTELTVPAFQQAFQQLSDFLRLPTSPS